MASWLFSYARKLHHRGLKVGSKTIEWKRKSYFYQTIWIVILSISIHLKQIIFLNLLEGLKNIYILLFIRVTMFRKIRIKIDYTYVNLTLISMFKVPYLLMSLYLSKVMVIIRLYKPQFLYFIVFCSIMYVRRIMNIFSVRI